MIEGNKILTPVDAHQAPSVETTDYSIEGEQSDVRAVSGLLFTALGHEKVMAGRRLGAGENSIAYEIELEGKGLYIFLVVKSKNAQRRLRRLHESSLMEKIQPPLPFAFPKFEFVSMDDPFIIGYPKIPGESLKSLLETVSDATLKTIGRNLRALHDSPRALVEQAPDDMVSPLVSLLDASFLAQKVQPHVPAALFARLAASAPGLLSAWQRLQSPLALTHGDLGADHILVDTTTGNMGMIDTERLCKSDPDGDLWKLTKAMTPEQTDALLRGYAHSDRAIFEKKRKFFELQRVLDQCARGNPAFANSHLEPALNALEGEF